MLRVFYSLFILFLVFSFDAYGQGSYKKAKWWKNNEIAKEINLSNDQVNDIESVFVSYKEKINRQNSALKTKQKSLRDAMRNPRSKSEDVLILSDDVDNLKSSVKRLRLEMLLKIREVLSLEQRIKLREIHGIKAKRKKADILGH